MARQADVLRVWFSMSALLCTCVHMLPYIRSFESKLLTKTVRLFCSVQDLPTAQLSLQLARATMPSSSVSALQQRTIQAALLAAPSTPAALQQLTG